MKVITKTQERERVQTLADSPSRIVESSVTTVTRLMPSTVVGKDLLITLTRLEIEESLKVFTDREDLIESINPNKSGNSLV